MKNWDSLKTRIRKVIKLPKLMLNWEREREKKKGISENCVCVQRGSRLRKRISMSKSYSRHPPKTLSRLNLAFSYSKRRRTGEEGTSMKPDNKGDCRRRTQNVSKGKNQERVLPRRLKDVCMQKSDCCFLLPHYCCCYYDVAEQKTG